MIENTIKSTGQKVYYKKLQNGLDVYLIPDLKRKNYFVDIVTFYGSNDLEYKSVNTNKFVKSPLGIAHFLEHKVFEMADGSDPFRFFSQSGTDVNAGTSYHSTKYYMWGSSNFKENVNYFIDMVFKPNFTTQNILKEQGIIQEEIKMYDDDPSWQLEDCLRNNLFYNLHVKEKIAGTVDSILDIDKENLYDAYDTFYQPRNMALVIGGNFQVDETLELLEKHPVLNKKVEKKEIVRKKIEEPKNVPCQYKEIKGNIVIPKLEYSFKIHRDNFSIKDKMLVNLYLNCIFSTIFGAGSDFEEQVYRDNLTTGYFYDCVYHDDYYILTITAESYQPKLFKEFVEKTLKNINVTENDLSRHKKMWIAGEIRISDRVNILVNSFIEDLVIYGKPCYNRVDVIQNLNYDELMLMVKELDLSNNTCVVMLPNVPINQ